jgi:RNA polymerase sigma-70 factor (ECF subfamily)
MQALLEMLPTADGPQSAEFDREVRRALFHRAAGQVQREVSPASWQAFWETGVLGTSPAEAAKKLGMTVGAVRVAKCRVLARLRALVDAWETEP